MDEIIDDCFHEWWSQSNLSIHIIYTIFIIEELNNNKHNNNQNYFHVLKKQCFEKLHDYYSLVIPRYLHILRKKFKKDNKNKNKNVENIEMFWQIKNNSDGLLDFYISRRLSYLSRKLFSDYTSNYLLSKFTNYTQRKKTYTYNNQLPKIGLTPSLVNFMVDYYRDWIIYILSNINKTINIIQNNDNYAIHVNYLNNNDNNKHKNRNQKLIRKNPLKGKTHFYLDYNYD
jgi:hypothetical protein